MIHAGGCGWVGRCAEDSACGVKNFEIFGMRGVDVVGGLVAIGVGTLEEISSNKVWKVRVADASTETVEAVWVVWGYHQGQVGLEKGVRDRTVSLGEEDLVVDRVLIRGPALIVIFI